MALITTSAFSGPKRQVRGSRWWVAGAAVAMASGLTGLDLIDRPPSGTRLRAGFVGPAAPEIRLRPLTVAAPAGQTGSMPTSPIPVPDDPYASEPIVEIGSLTIARLGVKERLMEGVTLRNIDLGPSHWPGSALPGGMGNMVVAGHRVTHGRPFRNIDKLAAGDEIVVSAAGVRATYKVATSFVVTPDRIDIADPTPTPTLTLFACHPPGSARQRYVVRADLIRSETA